MNSGRTAITRKSLSAPMKILLRQSRLINGTVLDFGCGKGLDQRFLRDHGIFVDNFDPNFFPEMPTGKYVTVTCNYVLNVVDLETEKDIINSVGRKLCRGGTAYFSVRRDLKEDRVSSINTTQRIVVLNATSTYKSSSFEIYILSKKECLEY